MPIICPAILAGTEEQYHAEMEKIGHFAHRIQIDLTDGLFAPSKTIQPEQAWWPVGVKADFHLMYKDPLLAIKKVLKHRAHMIIIHVEAEGDFVQVLSYCRRLGVKVGLALLPPTNPEVIISVLAHLDHVLIFSGQLGQYGGQTNLELLNKVEALKKIKPDLEIGWDGGINDQNVTRLVKGGVDVLNVGGFLQKAEDPLKTYQNLQHLAELAAA